jgi:excisionase family DNA binding protein
MTDTEILERARAVPVAELPSLIGKLAEASAVAIARLQSPAPAAKPIDELLSVSEAARRLGVSKTYLYHHEFPFARRVGRKLLFSAHGIQRFIEQQTNR